MNANYEWQRQQVEQRIEARIQDADRQRMAKEAGEARPGIPQRLFAPIKVLRPVLARFWPKRGAESESGRGEVVPRERLT